MQDPVEDLSARTESSSTVVNPDGTRTAREYGSPVRVENDDGSWSDIDFNLVEQPDGSYAPKVSATDITIGNGGPDPAAQVAFDDGSQIDVQWTDNSLPEPTVSGGVATYKINENVDLIASVIDGGVSTTIRFNQRPSESDRDLALQLKSDGLKVTETAHGGLQATNEEGDKVGRSGSMIAWDARKDEAGDPLKIVPVNAGLTTTTGTGFEKTQRLSLGAPDSFLDDPTTVYPVTVDPDISSVTRVRDTFVQNGDTTSNGTSHGLAVGSPSTNTGARATSYLQFSTPSLAGKKIVSAKLNLLQYYAHSCASRQLNIAPVEVSWVDSVIWTNRPAGRWGTGDDSNIDDQGTPACGNAWLSVEVKNMVEAWVKGTYPNYGFRLGIPAASETYPSFERRFCSMNPNASLTYCDSVDHKPYLSVTYDSYPGTPTEVSIEPNVSGVVMSTTPTFSAQVSDPDPGTVRARYNVYSGSSLVWHGDGSIVSNVGGTSVLEVPEGILTEGSSYRLEVYGNDGVALSGQDATAGGFVSVPFSVFADPVALIGFISNVAEIAPEELTASIAPDADVKGSLTPGQSASSYALESDAISVQGDQVELRFDPRLVPSDYIDSEGRVDFEVVFKDAETGVGAVLQATVRKDPVSGIDWIEPDEWVSGDAPTSEQAPPDVPGDNDPIADETTTEDEAEEPVAEETQVDDADDAGEAEAPGAVVGASAEPMTNTCEGSCSDWDEQVPEGAAATFASSSRTGLISKKKVWATIGTTYPVGGDKAWMTYTSATSGTYGVGMSVGGGFQQSAKKSIGMDWGQTFEKSPSRRSYRVEVEYGKYQMQNPVTGFWWIKWEPIKQTGGTQAYKLSTAVPSWTRCANVAAGTWWRGQSRGKDYSSSYGVKMKSVIGVDLSTTKSYSTSSRMSYSITGNDKKMCGNNDYPSKAAKFQEKYR